MVLEDEITLQNKLQKYLDGITPTNKEAGEKLMAYSNTLVKPPHSLGRIEDVAQRIAEITGDLKPKYEKKCSIICCSSNGILEEGVASLPNEFTYNQSANMSKPNTTGSRVLNETAGADLIVADIGVLGDLSPYPTIINKKIRECTWNFTKGPAMTRAEAIKSILAGIELVEIARDRGYEIIGMGEVAMGNTTTAAAIISVICQVEPGKIVGRGAGLSDEGLVRKRIAIEKGIALNKPNREDTIDVLGKVGGFEVGAMAGIYLGCAYYKIPVVTDGVISIAAALIADGLNPFVREYMIPSHLSFEPAYQYAADRLQMVPMFNMNMRLGEASGCPMTYFVIDMACNFVHKMASLTEGGATNEYIKETETFKF